MDDKEWDDIVQKTLTDSDGKTLYVKADAVELRAHIFGQLLPIFPPDAIDMLIDSARRVEDYIKYG